MGAGVKVGVFDTGISKHPDISLSGGASFIDGVESYADDNGHGTHVAGIVSSLINGQGILGAAPSADLYAVKVLRGDGTGSYSSIIEAIEWAIDNNINIINMSFGGGQYSSILEEAINKAYDNNILIFASAGNNGAVADDTIDYPAKFSNVIAVGAVDQSSERASFSSVGAELELVAPGVGINSTLNNGTYGSMSGTSMASPHAAGVAALLWSRDITVTNSTIRGLLDYSALGIGDSTYYGCGLVDAANALDMYDSYVDASTKNIDTGKKKVKKFKEEKEKDSKDDKDASIIINNVTEAYNLSSPNPYSNNYNNTWTISRTGASNIRVHFVSIQTEANYDYVRTSAGDNWSGTYSSVWSSWSGSGSINVSLTSDSSVVGNGFVIDMIEYVASTPPSSSDDHGNSMSSATMISLNTSVNGNINYAGDEDFFRFTASNSGDYIIASSGSTDTFGNLYNSSGTELASNDDSNGTANFTINYSLSVYTFYFFNIT